MFYSHEVLSSRKHGVATVWLIATLGSKSSLKRINRKSILEVNVPKACEVVVNPEAPMALRLQSNLLYGLSRVYDQQCGFMLSDVQIMESQIKQHQRPFNRSSLDIQTGTSTRVSRHLLLPYDPNFFPDFASDGQELAISTQGFFDPSPQLFSLQTPQTSQTTQNLLGIAFPSIESGRIGQFEDVELGRDDDGATGQRSGSTAAPRHRISADAGFLPPADFTFDSHGFLHSVQLENAPTSTDLQARQYSQMMLHNDNGMDIDDTNVQWPGAVDDDVVRDFSAVLAPQLGDEDVASVAHSERIASTRGSVTVPLRRQPKTILPDHVTELHNREISAWQNEYLENMTKTAVSRLNGRLPSIAKRNAEYWIWGQGVGGVGSLTMGTDHPLDIFHGQHLRQAITGENLTQLSGKRSHESTEDTLVDQSRRVRQRTSFPPGWYEADGFINVIDNDNEKDLEVGRAAPPFSTHEDASQDTSTFMPWNLVSHRSSTLQWGRATATGSSLHARSVTSATPLRQSHGSRFVSASPLYGRGSILYDQSLEEVQNFQESLSLDDDLSMGPGPGDQISLQRNQALEIPPKQDEQFEMFGPAAQVDTQTAAQLEWQNAALHQESENFKTFLENAISQKASSPSQEGCIIFGELLPTSLHSNTVAAQGLLHVLALATRGLLVVRQGQAFDDIWLHLHS